MRRIFIFKFAAICQPLTELTKKEYEKKFVWTPEAQEAFDNLKAHMEEAIEISSPLFDRCMYATSDASAQACAFSLYQIDDQKNVIYLGMSSKLFSIAERAISAYGREVLSITYGLTSYDYYLRFSPQIEIATDCISILWLASCKSSNSRMIRLSIILSNYNVSIRHVGGRKDLWLSDVILRSIEAATNPQLTDLTTKEADIIFKRVTAPKGLVITKEELKELLNTPGIQVKDKPKRTSTKSKVHNK